MTAEQMPLDAGEYQLHDALLAALADHGAAAPDTALVLRSLAAAGYRAGSDPEVDEAIRRLVPYCGRPFTADVDDTALTLTTLHQVGASGAHLTNAAIAETVRWLLERQSANGGWSRHGASRRRLLGERALTIAGLAAPATPLVTAHVVAALCAAGHGERPAVRRAQQFLVATQAVEGFWDDTATGLLHCTTQVVLAFAAGGHGRGNLVVEGAMDWVYERQNPDGGWGGKSGFTPGTDTGTHEPSTVTQTAQCLIAAHVSGVLDARRTEAAFAFLRSHIDQPDVRANAYAHWAIALHTAAGAEVPQAVADTAFEPAEYDTWSSLWWQRRGPLAILHWGARERAQHIPPASRPGAVLLDVACGGGLLHPHIADKGYRHIGVDVSTKSAEVARRHGVDEVLIHDIHNIPLPDGYADVVVAGYCLEHVERPFDVVAECCRVLKPGGTLVMDTIADTFLARLSVITLGEGLPVSWAAPKGTHDHRYFISPHRLVEACAAQGVPVDLYGVVPHIGDLLAWSFGRAYEVRLRTGTFTKTLYGVAGVKPHAAT
jgi:2-polyprenyl-6-hydroxyphenyl methylase/3-demethylubiquinone-9 3-methyltransferase